MNREEFMRQLEQLLIDVSEEEKEEALEYYRGYFEDAGLENEERILKELESPEKVAQTIKTDLGMGKSKGEEIYSERGYEDERFTERQEMGFQESKKEDNNTEVWKIILIVAVAILTSPIWIGFAGALLGGVLGVAGTLFGLLIAAGAVAGALYVAGVTVFCVGIGQLVLGSVGTGVALLGSGLLILALAILATIACVWIYGKFLPWLINGIIKLCKGAFSGRGKAK